MFLGVFLIRFFEADRLCICRGIMSVTCMSVERVARTIKIKDEQVNAAFVVPDLEVLS